MERLYGVPGRASFAFEVSRREFDRIRFSQRNGRNHDVTLYIRKGDRLAVNAKPFYPPGLYRAPSGGLEPGEDFHDGIRREVTEEVGCEIRLDRFVLRTAATFTHGDEHIDWRSFVFTADYVRGDFRFTDTREIAEVRLARWADFDTFGRIMRQSDVGGLHYRAALHEEVERLVCGDRK
ncbi:MAG TPA: NUDIX hydrolase [Acidobacteriota bacterium]|nr:NUDIX hydrolase [Acidobacteriota bacterium]